MARGIAARKSGDEFIDESGNVLVFDRLMRFPENSVEFNNDTDLTSCISQLSLYTDQVTWCNTRLSTHQAFCVALMKNSQNQTIGIGRFFKRLNKDGLVVNWQNGKDFLNYKLNTKNSLKERSPYSPSEMLKDKLDVPLSIDDVKAALTTNTPQETISTSLIKLISGELPVVFENAEKLGLSESIRDYACELVHPIILTLPGGIGEDLLSRKFSNQSDLKFLWNSSRNHRLIDSVIMTGDTTIGVSSKGNKGANPGITNLYDVFIKDINLQREYPRVFDVLKIIKTYNSIEGPLRLAVTLNLIPPSLADSIRSGNIDCEDGLVCDLLSRHKAKKFTDSYNVNFHIISNIAKLVTDTLNDDMNFTEGLLAAYNKIKIIQVYTKGCKSGDDFIITNFNAIYTPDFSGKILLDAGKHYTSSIIKGKLTMNVVN